MTDDIKAWWLTMNEKRLTNHLTNKLKYPPHVVQDKVARVKAMRAERKVKRLRRSASYDLWSEFLAPARAEAQTIRVLKTKLKNEGGEGTPKWLALDEYARVINVMIERFMQIQKSGEASPKQFPAWLKERGKRGPLYDGAHWTDYVSQQDRDRVTEMFASLPPPKRGRAKPVFTRTLPSPLYKNKRAALTKEINEAIALAEQEYDMAVAEHERERLNNQLDKLYEAMYRLDEHKKHSPLPNTWHGLLK